MPDGKPTRAPLIIFGTMVSMSIITVSIVFYFHSQRTEPYLETKMRRVKRVEKPEQAPTSVVQPTIPQNTAPDGGAGGATNEPLAR